MGEQPQLHRPILAGLPVFNMLFHH
jgi:hypothetical protein